MADTTFVGMQLQLQQFDEIFINECKKHGLSASQTQKELLENPARKVMVDAMVKSEQLRTEVVMRKQFDIL
jgi:hypothetical protein